MAYITILQFFNWRFTGVFRLLWNFSVGISVSPHVCFILDIILISMFLR